LIALSLFLPQRNLHHDPHSCTVTEAPKAHKFIGPRFLWGRAVRSAPISMYVSLSSSISCYETIDLWIRAFWR